MSSQIDTTVTKRSCGTPGEQNCTACKIWQLLLVIQSGILRSLRNIVF